MAEILLLPLYISKDLRKNDPTGSKVKYFCQLLGLGDILRIEPTDINTWLGFLDHIREIWVINKPDIENIKKNIFSLISEIVEFILSLPFNFEMDLYWRFPGDCLLIYSKYDKNNKKIRATIELKHNMEDEDKGGKLIYRFHNNLIKDEKL
jgi:hypothetical protein